MFPYDEALNDSTKDISVGKAVVLVCQRKGKQKWWIFFHTIFSIKKGSSKALNDNFIEKWLFYTFTHDLLSCISIGAF